MHGMYEFILTVSMGFFAMVNPITNTPLFHSYVENLEDKTRRKIALRAVVTSFVVVLIFTVFGKIIFKLFGITLPAFQIAGGIIVFIIGYERLHGRTSNVNHASQAENDEMTEVENLSTYPLAVPMLAGPGTIATAMSFAGQKESFWYTLIVVGIYSLICLTVYLCWVYSAKLIKIISPGVTRVVIRIMGLVVAVIAVQMAIYGIKNAIELYR